MPWAIHTVTMHTVHSAYQYRAREHSNNRALRSTHYHNTREHPNIPALRSTHCQNTEEQPNLTVLGQNNKDKGLLEMSMHNVSIKCS